MRVHHKFSRILRGNPARRLRHSRPVRPRCCSSPDALWSRAPCGSSTTSRAVRSSPRARTSRCSAVDLNEDSDFKDNKDKIKSVDEVGFVFRAQNNLGNAAHGVIYISATPILPVPCHVTAADITSARRPRWSWTGSSLRPGYTDIAYDESLALQVNQDVLHEHGARTGPSTSTGSPTSRTSTSRIDKLTAVVVMTVEL